MRRSIALCGIAVAIALLASSLALPAERAADRTSGQATELRVATAAPVATSIHRLLRGRLQWTLRLTRALRLVEQAPEPQPTYGTQTIIDDPDPAGMTKDGGATKPPPDNDGDEESSDREEQEDAVNEGMTPLRDFG